MQLFCTVMLVSTFANFSKAFANQSFETTCKVNPGARNIKVFRDHYQNVPGWDDPDVRESDRQAVIDAMNTWVVEVKEEYDTRYKGKKK